MSELSNGKGDELYVFKNIDVDSSALEGLVICFTGKFSRFNIEEAITIVELAGGEISNSINSSINIVVAGKNSANELEKADEIGLEVLDEEGFISFLQEISLTEIQKETIDLRIENNEENMENNNNQKEFYFVISDKPLIGSKEQSVNTDSENTYQIDCRWYVVNQNIVLENFEFDAYETFLENEDFHELLHSEIGDNLFALGHIDKLYLGVVDDSSKVVWQSKASGISSRKITSLEPSNIDWDQSPQGKPKEAILIRYLGCESDSPELPIHAIKGEDISSENVQIIVADLSSYGFSNEELVGVSWKGNELGIYGQGGSGYSPEYKFYKLNKTSIEEIQ
tara:strand:+ start:177 stop:1193 length:1017 start_codon:yes stop_codon:yes gene_type:complete